MTYFQSLFQLLNSMSPYLLLGFFIAGLLHVLVPRKLYSNLLAKDDFRSVLSATAIGIPLPLCSCGVIPTAMSLRKEGASHSATTSFLIATPQTGIDSIMATYSILGLPFAIIRPIAALCTAIGGGMFTSKIVKKRITITTAESKCEGSCNAKKQDSNKLVEIFRYGFVEMLQDVGKWLVIGLLLAALITVFVPDSYFEAFAHYPILNMLAILLFSIPMYLCATGSIPIAAALMLKGLTPGAAFVLLMAGPATNIAALLVIRNVLGKSTMWSYLLSIVSGALFFGCLIAYILPHEWFTSINSQMDAACCHTHTPLWQTISSILFILLVTNAFLQKTIKHYKNKHKMTNKTIYRIGGMSCNHCKNSVETHLAKLQGINTVVVDLTDGTACVEGMADEASIKKTVEELGFEYKGIKRP